MIEAILVGVAGLGWLVALLWLPALRRGSAQRFRVVAGWLSITSLAFAVSFQVLATRSTLEVHLALWYLAYVAFILALYFANAFAYIAFRRGDSVLLLLTLTALTIEYVAAISQLDYVPNHNTPRSAGEMLFMLTLLGAALVYTIQLVRFHYLGFLDEAAPPARFRFLAMTIMWGAATGYVTIKIYMAFFGYLVDPTLPPVVMQAHNTTMLIAGTAWVVGLLPNKILVPLTLNAPITIPIKLLAFNRLKRHISQIQMLELGSPTLPPRPASFLDLITNVDFHLYRSIIYVLDAKYLLDEGDRADFEGRQWTHVLQAIDDWQDYWLLVHHYSHLKKES